MPVILMTEDTAGNTSRADVLPMHLPPLPVSQPHSLRKLPRVDGAVQQCVFAETHTPPEG